MGRPISPQLRTRIEQGRGVALVTAEHVVLRDGRVLDPQEFIVARVPHHFVLKLATCRCWFLNHRLGTHVLVPGTVWEYGDGRTVNHYNSPPFCPNGNWIVEETLPG
jgi:hypothetical protein